MSFSILFAEPIEEREWTSTVGTRLLGSALEIEEGNVVLQRSNGTVIRVALNQLVDADRAILEKHFSGGEASSKNEKTEGLAIEGLGHPQGKIVGPVDGGGGKYFLYIPKSLVPGRLAPAFFLRLLLGEVKSI